MRKKTALIIAAVITAAGIATAVTAAALDSRDRNSGNVIDVNDPASLVAGASGKVYLNDGDLFEIDDGICTYELEETEDHPGTVIITGTDTNRFAAGRYLVPEDPQGRLIYNVRVTECPDEEWQKVYDYFVKYYDDLYSHVSEYPGADPSFLQFLTEITSDEGHEALSMYISHTKLEVAPAVNYDAVKTAGIVIAASGALMALCILLSFRFKAKHIITGLGIIVFAVVFISVFSVRKQIATVLSHKEYREGVYTVKYTADYKLDDIMEAGISDENGLLSWAEEKLYFGLPVSMKESLFGCAAFLVTDKDGCHLMGRNTDYPETDCLMIFCEPENGYDSIAMVDLSIVNIGRGEDQVSPSSFAGKAAVLAAPYFIVEGMNEAGLGISILELDVEEIHQDTGKKDILFNVAVRAALDRCATVEEAVSLFGEFDMNSMLGASFHLFVCDKTGRSVVVEWFGDRMYVKENPAVTNYVICTDEQYIDPGRDERYEVLMKELENCNCTADPGTAMGFLRKVGYDNRGKSGIGTEWSCIYDLDGFTVTVCFDVKYDEQIYVTRETFDQSFFT